MPNDTLITQLDQLREVYTQQQKAAATLQTMLKTIIAAQSKTQKALMDYSAQNTGLDVGPTQETFADLRLKEEAIDPLLPDLRRELKMLASLTGALKDSAAALRSEPADVVRLDKAVILLQGTPQQDIATLLPELNRELELAQIQLGTEFGQKLRDALAAEGISIGGRSPHFEIGRFELEVNFAKRFITLRYGKDNVVPRAPITVEAAIKTYDSASKSVMGRNQNGQAWISQFYEAYTLARRKRDAGGTRVNIVDCYVEMVLLRQGRAFSSEPSKRTFSDYTRAQFIHDFHEFAQRRRFAHNRQVVKAHVASKSQTDSPAKSMWMVEGDSPYDGRYVADVEFEKE
jgi:hypothetical protein